MVAAYEARQAASRQIKESRETVAEAIESLKLNMINIRHGAELPRATRPIEVLQPIQALAQAAPIISTRSWATTGPSSASTGRSAGPDSIGR